MARSPMIQWSGPLIKAYRGNLSSLRYGLDRVYSWLLQSPKAKPDVVKDIKKFAAEAGLNLNVIPTTSKQIDSGVKVTAPAITGTYVNGYTFTIVGGVITAIVAS